MLKVSLLPPVDDTGVILNESLGWPPAHDDDSVDSDLMVVFPHQLNIFQTLFVERQTAS